MNDRDRNRFEMIKRVSKFRTDNLSFFPAGPAAVDVKAGTLFNAVDSAKAAVQAAIEAREGASAGFHSGTTAQSTQRDGLLLDLLELNRAAAAIAEADGNPSLMDFFRMPHGVPDTVLVARARAMKTKAASMASRFTELGFAVDFATQLETRIVAFEAAGAGQEAALDVQAGHTASIGTLLKPGLVAVKQLDVICRQKFKSNAQKLGEWIGASHVERVASGGDAPTPPPPAPPTP